MVKKSIFSLLFVSVALFYGCSDDKSQETQQDKNTTLVAPAPAPTKEYVLQSLKDEQFVIKESEEGFIIEGIKDKIIIFDIFATWCPPCQGSASHLSSLQEKFKKDILIIGVTIEDGIANEKLEEFAKEYKAKYTLVNSAQNRHFVDAVASSLKLGERFPIPMMAMYKDGKLIQHYLGAVQEEFIEKDIKKALEK